MPDSLKKIYVKLDAKITREPIGHGLGLGLVHDINRQTKLSLKGDLRGRDAFEELLDGHLRLSLELDNLQAKMTDASARVEVGIGIGFQADPKCRCREGVAHSLSRRATRIADVFELGREGPTLGLAVLPMTRCLGRYWRFLLVQALCGESKELPAQEKDIPGTSSLSCRCLRNVPFWLPKSFAAARRRSEWRGVDGGIGDIRETDFAIGSSDGNSLPATCRGFPRVPSDFFSDDFCTSNTCRPKSGKDHCSFRRGGGPGRNLAWARRGDCVCWWCDPRWGRGGFCWRQGAEGGTG